MQEHLEVRGTRSQRSDLVLKHILQFFAPPADRSLQPAARTLRGSAAYCGRSEDTLAVTIGRDRSSRCRSKVSTSCCGSTCGCCSPTTRFSSFSRRTSRDRITQDIKRIEQRIATLDPQDTSAQAQKIRGTLTDNLTTSQDRLSNYDRAQANYEFVELEIDRLENKITSLAEVAVNRQEPAYVSSQVDQVANSMLNTEKTMNDLQVFTGLEDLDDEIPILLDTTRTSTR